LQAARSTAIRQTVKLKKIIMITIAVGRSLKFTERSKRVV